MGIMKAPSILTFIVALCLAIAAIVAKLGVAQLPLEGFASFWILLGAFVLLALGTVTRGF